MEQCIFPFGPRVSPALGLIALDSEENMKKGRKEWL